jgi:WD40 repeat protein
MNCEFSLDSSRLVVSLDNATARLYDPTAPDREPTTVELYLPGMASQSTLKVHRRGLWVVTTAESEGLPEPGAARPSVIPGGYELRLMSSVKDVSAIPTAEKRLVIVAAVDHVLHFRIFDDDGKMVVDTDETQRTAQAPRTKDLRKQLESLWPPHELTTSEKGRVIDAVTTIVGHTLSGGTKPAVPRRMPTRQSNPGLGQRAYLWNMSFAPDKPQPIRLSGFIPPRDSFDLRVDPNGRRLLVNTFDGRLLLWNLRDPSWPASAPAGQGDTGTWISRILLYPEGSSSAAGTAFRVRQFALSHDGRWLAAQVTGPASNTDNRPCVWDLETGVSRTMASFSPTMVLPGHEARITALAFSGDSRYLVTTSADSTSRVWNLSALSPSAQPFRVPSVLGDSPTGRPGLLSSDRRWLAFVYYDGVAELTELGATGERLPENTLSASGMLDKTTAPDPSRAFSKLGRTRRLSPPGCRARSVMSSADGRWLAVIGDNHDVILLDLKADDPAARPITLSGLRQAPLNLITDPEGCWFAVETEEAADPRDHVIRLWKLGVGRDAVQAVALKPPTGSPIVFAPHGRLVIGRKDGVFLWKLTEADPSPCPIELLRIEIRRYRELLSSPDGGRLVIRHSRLDDMGDSGQLQLSWWDLRQEDPRKSRRIMDEGAVPSAPTSGPTRYLLSGDNRRLLYIINQGEVGLLPLDSPDPASGRVILVSRGESASFPRVTDPARRWLVTSSDECGTRLWDLNADDPTRPIPLMTEENPVTAVFSHDGRWLATGSGEKARLWDLKDVGPDGLAPRSVLVPGLNGEIIGVAVSANKRLLLLGQDGVIRLFELNPGQAQAAPVAALPGHDPYDKTSMAVTPDGSRVISVAYDSVKVSTVPKDELMEMAGRAAGRNLSRKEWDQYIPKEGSYLKTFEWLPPPDVDTASGATRRGEIPRNPFQPLP